MRISKLLPDSKWKLITSSIGVLLLFAFLGLVLVEAAKAEVTIINNGEKETVRTHANTVEELLNEVGIAADEHDELTPARDAEITNGMKISYKKAKEIYLSVDGDSQQYYTTAETIAEFLQENDIALSAHDELSLDLDEKIKDGMRAELQRAYQIIVKDGKKKKRVWTTGGTVEQLLAANDITYDKDSDDKIKPALDKKVNKDTVITIVRVTKKQVDVEETIAYETETKADDTMEKGDEKVISEGQEGKVVKTYEVTMENGKETGRELINEVVEVESKNRVVAVGTKEPEVNSEPAAPAVASSGGDTSSGGSGGKVFYMNASAYTANCSGCSGVTSTGINLKANPNMKVVAVDPSIIPIGSKVWVEGYGTAIAGDTGGSINGNRIDLHFPTKSSAYAFGRKTVKLKIID